MDEVLTPAEEARQLVDALGPEALAKAAAYTSGSHWLLLWGFLVSVLVTWLVVRSGLLDRLSARFRGKPVRAAFLVSAAALVLTSLISLPWDLYAGWWRETHYGRTSQPLGDWLGQGAIALAVSALMGGAFFTGLYALIRRGGRLWWLWGGGLAAAALSVFLLLSPVLIEPLFNDYRPVPAGPVRDALVVQAQAAGVPAERIFVYDGSRQSNNFTANVSGVGGSARIAISDVAFKGASLDEVRAVTGHEIGHYVLGHVWRSVALFSGLAIVGFWLVDRLYPRVARQFGARAPLADPAGLPVLLFIVGALGLLAQPLINAFTRSGEREADAYSLKTVNLPDALAGALVKTAEYRDPRPSKVQEVLFYTHPSVERRVERAMEWKAANPPG
jgi:STE24 endopeptidase